MRYRFGLCGAFDFEERGTGGQSIKTREFYYSLCDEIDKNQIRILESTDYKRNPFLFFINFVSLLRSCERVIVFPAQNGIKVFAPICYYLKRRCKVYYSVIGGWLPQMLESNNHLYKYLSSFQLILVETDVMKDQLKKIGLNNVYKLVNFKRISPVKSINQYFDQQNLRLCFFSRVIKEKGIEDSIKAVKRVNQGGVSCTLDIYGPVVDKYASRFTEIKKKFPPYIQYKGAVDPKDSVSIIKQYDMQLFPTHYRTEGIPGSIIDSYFAGVPVISSRWNSYAEIVKDGITGLGYEIGNIDELVERIEWSFHNPKIVNSMKLHCLKEAQKYTPHNVLLDFLEYERV